MDPEEPYGLQTSTQVLNSLPLLAADPFRVSQSTWNRKLNRFLTALLSSSSSILLPYKGLSEPSIVPTLLSKSHKITKLGCLLQSEENPDPERAGFGWP